MSIADLRRCAIAYNWQLEPGGWHEQLAARIHHNKVLHIFRHAELRRDPSTGMAVALHFTDADLARGAKADMHHVDAIFGARLALMTSEKRFVPHETHGIALGYLDEVPMENLRGPQRVADTPLVVPVNDLYSEHARLDDAALARAKERLFDWRHRLNKFETASSQREVAAKTGEENA